MVHKLISTLIVMGEKNTARMHLHNSKSGMLHHQNLIHSVKEQIKPGMFAIAFKPFTLKMLKAYF